MKKLIALILTGMFFAVGAEAGVRLNILGGVSMDSPSSKDSSGVTVPTYKSKTGITYGATLDFAINPMIAIETGVLSVGQKIRETFAGSDTDISTRSLEIPFLVRFTALPIVDFGVGGYYQKFNSTFDATDVATGTKLPGLDWNTQMKVKTADYGAKLSARLMLPVLPMMKFVVDASYKLGLANMNDSAQTNSTTYSFKTAELSALGGLSFGF